MSANKAYKVSETLEEFRRSYHNNKVIEVGVWVGVMVVATWVGVAAATWVGVAATWVGVSDFDVGANHFHLICLCNLFRCGLRMGCMGNPEGILYLFFPEVSKGAFFFKIFFIDSLCTLFFDQIITPSETNIGSTSCGYPI